MQVVESPDPVENNDKHQSTKNGIQFGWPNVQSMYHKTMEVSEFIKDQKYDVFIPTETWHQSNDDIKS